MCLCVYVCIYLHFAIYHICTPCMYSIYMYVLQTPNLLPFATAQEIFNPAQEENSPLIVMRFIV